MEEEEIVYKWYKIFDSLAHAQQMIPVKKMQTIRKGLKKIVLVHNSRGLFALEDACPHKLVPLSQGQLNEREEIVCFWHQYTFEPSTGEEVTGKNIRPCKLMPLLEKSDGLYLGIPEMPPQDDFSF